MAWTSVNTKEIYKEIYVVWGQHSDQTGLPVFLCAFGCRQAADEFLYTANRADPVQTLRVSPVAFVDGEMNFVPKEAA
jgi:hypothetical protein